MRQVTNGDKVRVHYVGTFPDGTEFDSSTERGPIEVTVGNGEVVAGFENALIGMAEGESKSVTLEPENAYGPHDPELLHVVERSRIPAEIDLQVGTLLQASNDSGHQVNLQVVALEGDDVTMDANHPMAGKTLNFELSLVGFVS